MKGERFENRVKAAEDEVLALKTASVYSSVRSANFTSTTLVRTGLYRITYGSPAGEILSNILCGTSEGQWGIAYPRTPGTNTQIVEVETDRFNASTQTVVTFDVPIAIVSNRPVISIERIS